MRPKHPKDGNHKKPGWAGDNLRYKRNARNQRVYAHKNRTMKGLGR